MTPEQIENLRVWHERRGRAGITLSQADEWMMRAGVIQKKVLSITDTGQTFSRLKWNFVLWIQRNCLFYKTFPPQTVFAERATVPRLPQDVVQREELGSGRNAIKTFVRRPPDAHQRRRPLMIKSSPLNVCITLLNILFFRIQFSFSSLVAKYVWCRYTVNSLWLTNLKVFLDISLIEIMLKRRKTLLV